MDSDSSDRSFFDDDTRMNPGSNFIYSPLDKMRTPESLFFTVSRLLKEFTWTSSDPFIRTSPTTKLSHTFGATWITRTTLDAETELL